MRMTALKLFYPLMLATLFISVLSCSTEDGTEPVEAGFDRVQMLENMADNLIVPAYIDLQDNIENLQNRVQEFTLNPSTLTLSALRESWDEAYLSWQYANAYNFGPAGEQGIRKTLLEEIATFPVSVSKIEAAIAGTPNFNDFNRDARGFLVVEYLIFGDSKSDTQILNDFSSSSRKTFLTGAVNDIADRVEEVLNAWQGSYRGQFTQNAGTDAGSSTSLLYNEFVKSFETAKNFKLGLPLGRRPGQTVAAPQLVEAYYSGQSLRMLEAHIQAIENIWYGRDKSGNDGIGFKEYLASVEGGLALIASTDNQLAEVRSALQAVPRSMPLSVQITSAPSAADRLHTELQKHTRFFKSDMSSLLGIAITFSSGDGD